MSTLTSSPPDPTTTTPPPGLLTAAEFYQRYPKHRVELVCGLVKEMPMPDGSQGRACIRIGRFLDEFAETHDLGRVMSNDTFIQVKTNPDTVFGADVLFISYQRLPKGDIPVGVLTVLPELVVEVRSPSDSWNQVLGKVNEYLQAGVTAVMVVNTQAKALAIYRAKLSETHFGLEDVLTIPDVLPGFSLPVHRVLE